MEMFYKNSVLKKFHKIHKKTPVPESVFNKVAGLISSYVVISPNQGTINSCVA